MQPRVEKRRAGQSGENERSRLGRRLNYDAQIKSRVVVAAGRSEAAATCNRHDKERRWSFQYAQDRDRGMHATQMRRRRL